MRQRESSLFIRLLCPHLHRQPNVCPGAPGRGLSVHEISELSLYMTRELFTSLLTFSIGVHPVSCRHQLGDLYHVLSLYVYLLSLDRK